MRWGLLVLLLGLVDGKGSAVQKVISTIKEVKEQIIAEGADEKAKYGVFGQWCRDTLIESKQRKQNEKNKREHAEDELGMLDTKMNGLTGERDELTSQSESLTEKKDKHDKECTKGTDETEEKIKTAKEALGILDKILAKFKESPPSLVQIEDLVRRSKPVSVSTKAAEQVVMKLALKAKAAPSRGVNPAVDAVQNLKEELLQEKRSDEAALQNQKHNCDMKTQAFKDGLKNAERRQEEIKNQLLILTETNATWTGKKDAAVKAFDAAKTLFADTEVECEQKQSEWKVRSSSRQGEIDACDKAIELLGSHTGVLSSTNAKSLLQLSTWDPRLFQASAVLAQAAKATGSKALAQLAIAAKSDPFADVKQMIEKMVAKLQKEQEADSNEKTACHKQLLDAEKNRDEKMKALPSLETDIDSAKADAESAANDIVDKSKDIRELQENLAEKESMNRKVKEDNDVETRELKDALKATQAAITEIGKAGKLAETQITLVQSRKGAGDSGAPATWDKEWETSLQPVLSLLEELQTSLDARVQELAAWAPESTEELENTIKTSNEDLSLLQEKKAEQEKVVLEKTQELVTARESLAAYNQTVLKLDDMCGDKATEERKRLRGQEIESLEKALQILSQTAGL